VSSGVERIGANILFLLPNRGGRETASRQLIGAIQTVAPDVEVIAYAPGETAAMIRRSKEWARGVTIVEAPPWTRWAPLRIGAELAWLPGRAARDRVQVLHSQGNTAPLRSRMPSVMTIHDLHYHHFPKIQGAQTRAGLRLLVPAAARRATRVVTPSEATKGDVVEILGVDPERVDVVPHGPGRPAGDSVGEADLRRRYGLGDAPIVFCPAVGFGYKNFDRLLTAFASVARSTDAMLVQVGWPAVEGAALREQARELGIGDRVRFLGWVDDRTIEGLYSAASLLVQPSLAEGFGLPVLEAMRRDLPVACSNASALPEVAGDAAEMFDPRDPDAIAQAMLRLLSDPGRRQELIERGRRRARRFSWERAAEAMLEVYARALEG
jgi:glycosyltransferase involved in cell wall biosynthesis